MIKFQKKEVLDESLSMLFRLINIRTDLSDLSGVIDHLNELISVQGLSAYSQSSAKYYYLLDRKDSHNNAMHEYSFELAKGLSKKISALQSILKVQSQEKQNSKSLK